jgi:hypothetical protein
MRTNDSNECDETKGAIGSMMQEDDYYPMLNDFRPKIDVPLTEWISSIRNSSIRFLDKDDPFQDIVDVIQVKQMNQNDHLPKNEDPLDISSIPHEFDAKLDVIKLPKSNPIESSTSLSEYLFIRPDDYLLFFHLMTNQKNVILTGNSGISKSWFQYKYILFCYRPDLWETLWATHAPSYYPMNTETGYVIVDLNGPDMSKKISSSDPILMKEGSLRKNESTLPTIFPNAKTIPKLIVRTKGGTESYLFTVDRSDGSNTIPVKYIKHDTVDLKWFTNGDSTILWEPSVDRKPVEYERVEAPIIATVLSEQKDQYIGFRTNGAKLFYMPCPSEIHLRLMGKVMREARCDTEYPTDAVIRTRVQEYGYSIRLALQSDPEFIREHERINEYHIKKICDSPDGHKGLSAYLSSEELLFNDDMTQLGSFSFRLTRFDVNRYAPDGLLPYQTYKYTPISTKICQQVRKHILRLTLPFVRSFLHKNNTEILSGVEEYVTYHLERLFLLEITSKDGLNWSRSPLYPPELEENDEFEYYLQISLSQYVSNSYVSSFQGMSSGIVYHPDHPPCPLMDIFWTEKDSSYINCLQPSYLMKHRNAVSMYNAFLSKLAVPVEVKLRVYFLILPRDDRNFTKESADMIQFWTDIQNSGIDNKALQNRIEFYSLSPFAYFLCDRA